jgi:hypothetical protein
MKRARAGMKRIACPAPPVHACMPLIMRARRSLVGLVVGFALTFGSAGCTAVKEVLGPTSPTSVSPGPTEQFTDPMTNMPSHERAVRKRGARDLDCPEEKIDVESLGDAHYRAAGCGRSALYNCVGGGSDRNLPRCDRESTP